MKPSRRGFLGGLIGAAAAGPATLAEAARSSLALGDHIGMAHGIGGYSQDPSHYDEASWLRTELARLTGLTREEKRLAASHMLREIDRIEVDTLRSVSLRHKLHMMHDRQIERDHRAHMGSIIRRLAEVAKR